jgi:hypothetical protein
MHFSEDVKIRVKIRLITKNRDTAYKRGRKSYTKDMTLEEYHVANGKCSSFMFLKIKNIQTCRAFTEST